MFVDDRPFFVPQSQLHAVAEGHIPTILFSIQYCLNQPTLSTAGAALGNSFCLISLIFQAVHLDADTARDEPSLSGKSAWSLRLYHGRWQRGVTAGGCRNNAETFHLNPKLALTLRHQDEVVIALNQHA